jgi:membrane protein implicated in regulation of membrane protease activity
MDLKPHEIILAVLAVAIPVVVLTLAFIPGGLDFVFHLAVDRVWGPVVFFGGAAILFAVLAWRIYRRIRPAAKKEQPKPAPHVSPTRMPKVEGSAAVERLKNRKPQA